MRRLLAADGDAVTPADDAFRRRPGSAACARRSFAAGQSLVDFFADKPLLNRLLMPLMIWNVEQQVWQYPGQLVADGAQPSGFGSVVIPVVQYNRDGTGIVNPATETVSLNLIPVVEEITARAIEEGDGPLSIDPRETRQRDSPAGSTRP